VVPKSKTFLDWWKIFKIGGNILFNVKYFLLIIKTKNHAISFNIISSFLFHTKLWYHIVLYTLNCAFLHQANKDMLQIQENYLKQRYAIDSQRYAKDMPGVILWLHIEDNYLKEWDAKDISNIWQIYAISEFKTTT